MSHKRKNKGTRPFMPLHGGKTIPHANCGCGSDADAVQVDVEDPEVTEEVGCSCRRDEDEPQDEATASGCACAAAASDLDAVRAERDSYLDMARRERADFDNYRKRMVREMAEMKRQSLSGFLKEFFGPLEDMHRVLQESEKSQSFESLVGGVRLMEENFWRALTKAGVKKIDAKDQPFDPNRHEAMAAVPSADVPPNTILEVYENGYTLDDVVLRPARVVVSRAPDA